MNKVYRDPYGTMREKLCKMFCDKKVSDVICMCHRCEKCFIFDVREKNTLTHSLKILAKAEDAIVRIDSLN